MPSVPACAPSTAVASYRRRHADALAQARRPPADPAERVALVGRLHAVQASAAVRDVARRLPLHRLAIPELLRLAGHLSAMHLPDEAMAALDEACRGDPDFPPALCARAQAGVHAGRFGAAHEDLARCLHRAPEYAQAHWLLSRLQRWTPTENHADRLRRRLSAPGVPDGDVPWLAYALHKELDDLGAHAEAWSALALACRTRRAQIAYDPADTRALVDCLRSLPDPVPARDADPARGRPVFIVGLHRSGTTLLQQLLAGHPQVAALGELYDFPAQLRLAGDHAGRGALDLALARRSPRFDPAALGSGYLDAIDWRRRGREVSVDKLPSNFLNLGLILAALPQARVLHVVRDPVETGFSALRERFGEACPYSYDMREWADHYRHYRALMAHWHARWPGRILDVPYAGMLADGAATMARVAAFCSLDLRPAMLDPGGRTGAIATASAVQARASLRAPARPAWQAYARELAPLQAALAAGADA